MPPSRGCLEGVCVRGRGGVRWKGALSKAVAWALRLASAAHASARRDARSISAL